MKVTVELVAYRIDEIIKRCADYTKELTEKKARVTANGKIPSQWEIEYLENYSHEIDDLTQHITEEEPSFYSDYEGETNSPN